MQDITIAINTDPFLLFFGAFYVILGVSFVLAQAQWKELLTLFVKYDAVSLFLGIIILPISLFIIVFYNNWDSIGSTVLMVIGYLGLVKSIVLLVYPKLLQGFVKKDFVQKWMWLDGLSGVIIGATMLAF